MIMQEPKPWRDELQALCEAVIESRLTPEEAQRLERLVLENPAARRFYVEYLDQHGSLHWSAAEPVFLPPRDVSPPRQQGMESNPILVAKRHALLVAVLIAATVLLVVGLWLAVSREQSPRHLGTLTAAKTCKWEAGSLPTEDGAQLSAGRLRLAEGIARIVFTNGAEITIEAPADLELVAIERCILHAGRLVAKVPAQASGFTVDTPTAVLKDLGTEFGVHVKDAKTADVQVFNGIVDVKHRGSGQVERLETGNNRRFEKETVTDFDPQSEKPAVVASAPKPAEGRTVHISTALGRGKDAYIQPIYPSEHSSDILLLVKNSVTKSSGYYRKAYLGLDLTSIAGMKVVDAQLNLTFAPTGMGFASEVPDATFIVYGLTDETLDDWDERTIRWNNAPANRPGGADVDPDKVVRLGTFEMAQGMVQGTRGIAGQALADFLNRDTNGMATLIVVRETPGSGRTDLVHGFANKNHPSLPPPTLKLTVVPR
jgi:ferric-dicitrate binding protein FerR (iron transport regulator)